jgi:hypothetical protein
MHCICYIAVHEDLTGLAVADCCFGDATVCAADPQDFWCLALGEQREGVGVARCGAFLVGEVAGEEVGEGVWGWDLVSGGVV